MIESHAEKFEILDSIPVGACILQEDFTVIFWNRCLEEWTKIPKNEIVGIHIGKYFPHLNQPKYEIRLKQIFEGGPPTIFSSQLHKQIIPSSLPNGKLRIQQAMVTSVARPDSKGFYALLIVQDVTDLTQRIQDYRSIQEKALAEIQERQRSQEALHKKTQELEQRNLELTQLSEMGELLQACLTVKEAYAVINKSLQGLFPDVAGGLFVLDASQQLVESVAIWGDDCTSKLLFHPHECWALRRGRVYVVDAKHPYLMCKHLCNRPAEYCCIPMLAQGESLGILYLNVNQIGELTEAKQRLANTVAEHIALALANLKLRETLHHQSIRDSLTGLFNRRYMEEFLARELNRCDRQNLPLSIIMIDIDKFKSFNDTFGHEAGDLILRELGGYLQKNIRALDIVCRYGGEEFLLILPEASLQVAQERAEQIRQGIKRLNLVYRRQSLGAITASFGVACFPEQGLTGDAVIYAADVALYMAKSQGRDRVVIAS